MTAPLVASQDGKTTYSHPYIRMVIRDLRDRIAEAMDELSEEPATEGVKGARCALARGLRLTQHMDLDS